LELEGEGDMALERWAVRRKAELFEKTFEHKLEMAGEAEEDDEDDEDD
jgi:hypothetical protein